MREDVELWVIAFAVYSIELMFRVPLEAVVLRRLGAGAWHAAAPLILRMGRGPALAFRVPLPIGFLAYAVPGASRDAAALRARVAAWRRASFWLRAYESLMFLAVFGGGAALILFGELPFAPVALGAAATWLLVALEGWWQWAALEKPLRAPMQQMFTATLSPVVAMRFHDALGKSLLAGWDPLAWATLLPEVERAVAFRKALVRARVRGESDAEIAAMAREVGVEPDVLVQPPVREGAHALRYCPACHAQYVIAKDACATCEGVPLAGW